MSVYTTQLRYICEAYAGQNDSGDYKSIPVIISAALPKLFDFDFPLYDPAYKKALETKIVNHYYFREIGAETTAQFKFMLSRTLNEIMPYYNKLYAAADIDFNPFYDVDYYKDHKGTDDKRHVKSESGSSTGREVASGANNNTSRFTGTAETETAGNRETGIESESTTTFNTTDTRTLNTQNQITYNSIDTKTLNTTDTKTLNTTDTKTFNTTDTVRELDTPQGALTGIEGNNYLSRAVITDKTGTESLARTGTESLTRTGTETVQKTGSDTTTNTGTDTNKKTGTETINGDETQTATESSSSTQESSSTTTDTGTSTNTIDRTGDTTSNGTENINGTDQYLDHVYGKAGSVSYATLFNEYREALINIDMMVINELEVCFMNLF